MTDLEAWGDFNVAMVGATAALAGLVIVAASVNIREIVQASSLTARLAAGIAALVAAIIGAALGLVPEITATWYGGIMLLATLAALGFQIQATIKIVNNRHPENRMRWLKSAVGFVPVAVYLAGSVLLLAGVPAGLALFAAGAILAIVSALIVSWIVLVEVLR